MHKQLLDEADIAKLPEPKRYVSFTLDKMKIKEELFYNEHSGSIIGFTGLGDINNELMRLQQNGEHPPTASHAHD